MTSDSLFPPFALRNSEVFHSKKQKTTTLFNQAPPIPWNFWYGMLHNLYGEIPAAATGPRASPTESVPCSAPTSSLECPGAVPLPIPEKGRWTGDPIIQGSATCCSPPASTGLIPPGLHHDGRATGLNLREWHCDVVFRGCSSGFVLSWKGVGKWGREFITEGSVYCFLSWPGTKKAI